MYKGRDLDRLILPNSNKEGVGLGIQIVLSYERSSAQVAF